ncbi:lipoprotein [uncultured Aquimarina sp.]|uniref:lipoprotein n=1 Tax=uncultured Aquimarina sp. TaxID=575652 RepID=UPI00260F27A6|nr:lipoprotein [uncultured Aquimarina sp.]
MKKIITILVTALLLSSCSNKSFDSKEDLWNYLNNPENKYIHTKTVNGVNFSIVYKPTDLLVDQELSGQVSAKKIDSLRSKYDQYLYFNLSMAKNNQELLSNVAGNKQQFGAMVNQLAFGMEQKIHFYTPQKDTIAMADYIYPRMYGMSGATTILLVYPKETMVTNAEHMTLSIEDLGFYTGEVKFKIPTKIFKDELKLTFE